jgi:hypothetical protein
VITGFRVTEATFGDPQIDVRMLTTTGNRCPLSCMTMTWHRGPGQAQASDAPDR